GEGRAAPAFSRRPARAMPPRPPPKRVNASRRLRPKGDSNPVQEVMGAGEGVSAFRNAFVEVQKSGKEGCDGGDAGGLIALRDWRTPGREKGGGILRSLLKVRELLGEESGEDRFFGLIRETAREAAEGVVDEVFLVVPVFPDEKGG